MKNIYSYFVALMLASMAQVSVAAEIVVFPTGDSEIDRTNVHAALAGAAAGDTILLKAGVFNLTPPNFDPSDCALDVSVPLPDSDSFWFWDAFAQQPDPCNPNAPQVGAWGERNSIELYMIDKPLTIEGESGPSGPLTILRVDNRFSDIFHQKFAETGFFFAALDAAFLNADAFFFVVGARDVKIKDIEFDGSSQTILTYWAGTTVDSCIFRGVGQGPHFQPDERSIYPHFPANFNNPIKSTFKNNLFVDAQQGIHIGGSEIVAMDNVFDHYGLYGIFLSAYAAVSLPVAQGGEGIPLVRQVAQNNRVEDNDFVNGRFGAARIVLDSWWGGPVVGNIVAGNNIVADGRGILVLEGNGWSVSGTTVANNNILENVINVGGIGVAIWGGHDNKIESNYINGPNRGIWIEWTYDFADLNPTAQTFFMLPATNNLVKNNEVTNASRGIMLGAFARDNTIIRNNVQGSSSADYWLEGSVPLVGSITFGPASGNVLMVDDGASVTDFSGCTNTESCAQYDDDGDGLLGEDPPDYLNDDGDSLFGFLSLVDEDPEEMPNVIREK